MAAISSQGTTASFNGVTLGALIGVDASFSSPGKEIRPLSQNIETTTGQYLAIFEQTTCEQTCSVDCIATTDNAVGASIVGSKGPLGVNGTGWFVSFGTAICESFQITGKVGDVVRFKAQFKRTYE